MIALIIIGVIVLLIALIMLIPVGADIGYEKGRLKVSAKACGMLMPLYPKAPEEKEEKKEKKTEAEKQASKDKPAKEKKSLQLPQFSKEELLEVAKAGIGAVGRFGKKLKVDRFMLHYTAAGKDPYNTALTFAYVNAALSSLAPMCARRFTVKDCSVWTDVDFNKDSMELDFGLAMSIRIGQIMAILIGAGFKVLGIIKRNKARLKAEAAAKAAEINTAETGDNQPVMIEKSDNSENIQTEERKNSNG